MCCSYGLEVETECGADLLSAQVFSLTGVPEERQRLFSTKWDGPLPPHVDELCDGPYVVSEGDTLVLWPRPEPSTQAAPAAQRYQDAILRFSIDQLSPQLIGIPPQGPQSLLRRCWGAAKYGCGVAVPPDACDPLIVFRSCLFVSLQTCAAV